MKYAVVVAAIAGGCYAIYDGHANVGAGLIGFAGLLTDYAELKDFASTAVLNLVRAWKGGA